jgi:type I restriction enzyme S subunit
MASVNLSDAVHIPQAVFDQMRRVSVQAGDVLLNITGASIGRVAMVEQLQGPAVVSQHVSILRPLRMKVLPEYLVTYLALPEVQSKIMVEQSGASRQALNHQQIRAMKIPVPDMIFQRNFADELDRMQNLKRDQVRSGRESASFNGSLTAQLMGANFLSD